MSQGPTLHCQITLPLHYRGPLHLPWRARDPASRRLRFARSSCRPQTASHADADDTGDQRCGACVAGRWAAQRPRDASWLRCGGRRGLCDMVAPRTDALLDRGRLTRRWCAGRSRQQRHGRGGCGVNSRSGPGPHVAWAVQGNHRRERDKGNARRRVGVSARLVHFDAGPSAHAAAGS